MAIHLSSNAGMNLNTLLGPHRSRPPAALRGCCPEEGEADGSPHACRIPAACPGLGPALAASSPPGHGQWQLPPAGPVDPSALMSGRSQCSRTDGLLRWCCAPILIPAPPPPDPSLLSTGPAELFTFSSKHGPLRLAGPTFCDPSMPSECSPQSWFLLQTRGFTRAELCHIPPMGTPRGGLKLPTQLDAFPGQSHASPSDMGLLQKGCVPWLRWRPASPVRPTRSCSCRL